MRVWEKLLMLGGWFSAEQALGFHFGPPKCINIYVDCLR